MALNEACQLWIEQRIEEELERQPETEISRQEMGRIIAGEILEHFEVEIKPTTIAKRADRIAATNVATAVTPPPDSEIQNNQVENGYIWDPETGRRVLSSTLTEDRQLSQPATHGGSREGSGAPLKHGGATRKAPKKNYNRFWMSIANQINLLARRISDDGGFPIVENTNQETMNQLIDALNLINQILREVR